MPLGIDGGIAARFFDNPLFKIPLQGGPNAGLYLCLLYTSDAADE